MRKVLLLTLLLSLLLPLPALGEADGFDLGRLEAVEGVYSFEDVNTVDMVYRFPDQPFLCQTDGEGTEVVAFIDFVSLALEGCVVPRLTLAVISPEPLYGDTLLLTVGGACWRLNVFSALSEYDGTYYEDYSFCFSADSLPLLSSLGGSKGKDAAFTLLDGEEALLSGTVAFSPEAVSTLYELFEDCGGKDQPLEAVAERWPFEKEKAK